MKVERFSLPKSSFLSIEKDMGIITDKVLSCDRLKKLLYYTTEDALDKPNLTIEQSNMLFGKNIKIVPKLTVDGSVLNYIMINFDNLKSDLDSLGIYYYETDIDSINNHGGYKISLYYNYGEDFHFIREDFDGKWSHKMGYSGSIERVEPSERIFKYNLVTTYEIVKPNIRKLLR